MTVQINKHTLMGSRIGQFQQLAVVAFIVSLMINMPPAAAQPASSGQAARANPGPARWENTIKEFEASDAMMPPPQGAVLLIGGCKTGDDRWYEKMVPIADDLYDEHLKEIGK